MSDDFIIPNWLTKNYLENVLKKYKKDLELRILDLDIKPAIPKGSNYASILTRVQLNYQSGNNPSSKENLSILLKSKHEDNQFITEIQKPYQIFKTEMAIYEKILPQLTIFLQKIGDENKIFADTIFVDYENEVIIFEDLTKLNYVLTDRLIGLNLKHTKWALEKLAKMHATAAVFNENTKNSLEQFTRGIFNHHTRNLGSFFENVIGVCAEFAGNCQELGEYYKEKLLKLKPNVVEYATKSLDLHLGQFHTLNHGDIWTNNIMIRYKDVKVESGDGDSKGDEDGDENEIDNMLLIDFQFCKWTSPALDLHALFNTSLENDLRFNRQDELIQYYHGTLVETLMKLNYKSRIPSLHELCIEMEARRFYAVIQALVLQPLMINEGNKDADLLACHSDDERGRNFRKSLYLNKVVQENTKKLLPYFDKHGLLDVYY